MDTLEDKIQAFPLFAGLSDSQLRFLASCAWSVTLPAGSQAGRQGEPADRFYAVLSGQLAANVQTGDGGPLTLQLLGPGQVLGWSWLFPPHLWHFDIVALEDTTAMAFDGVRIREECERDHDLGYAIVTRFAQIVVQRLLAASLQLAAE